MTEETPLVVLTEADIHHCIGRVAAARHMVYDVETSGLNPRRNHIVAYVITLGPRPEDTFYVPVRHQQGGNCLDWRGLEEAECGPVELHPFEIELAKVVNRPTLIVTGHNLLFDLLMSAHKKIFFGGRTECTQVAMSLINETLYSYSLDSCAKYMQVTEKKGDALYFHMAKLFGGEPDKKQMAHYWRLSGADPLAIDYACGDGISTWELVYKQYAELEKQELTKVWNIECRVTRTLFRMQYRGIKIDTLELSQMTERVTKLCADYRLELPAPEINVNSAKQLRGMFDLAGINTYPMTEKGNPSFTEDWLETNELGAKVVSVRKMTTLVDRFITPLQERHLVDGRIAPNYNQLRGDDFGTITGRLSCNDPNIQQVYKRDKKLGKIFRKIFIPDDGMEWSSNDYSQCEPRIFTHYTGSPLLRDGYLAVPPVDFYQTLSNVTGIPRSPTAGIAGNCKQLALSIFYGAGVDRTAEMIGVTRQKAKDIRQMVQEMCPEVGQFAKEATRRAKERGYVKTVLGRRIRYNGGGEFRAAGHIVAGGNADLIKTSLVEVDEYLMSENLPPPIATVHDSIEAQIPKGRTDINREIVRIMEACGQSELINFSIPQVVDNGLGPNWAFATYRED